MSKLPIFVALNLRTRLCKDIGPYMVVDYFVQDVETISLAEVLTWY